MQSLLKSQETMRRFQRTLISILVYHKFPVISSSYASVSDKEYYNKNGTWTKVNEEESTDLNSLGMTTRQKEEYFNLI